ncbi:cytoplasmic dynein 2 light intermediate chain 1 [Copidosoma floridanum]|uniref:cytoplasmic dynein 2 light intermediate chain 1 n=1 Tax=Copidosoma floridanum TaxID=29053 RepID=UPI0006C9AA2D|nr:cytoplasmic dynein 2 light intermediate chain 1 [Copidosoma floridanum]
MTTNMKTDGCTTFILQVLLYCWLLCFVISLHLTLFFVSDMSGKVVNRENTRELALKIATEEEKRRKTDPTESHEKSLIIVGSKEVGKTTMIYRFLEKEDTPKATLAMDYSYGRKAGKSLIKDVVHVWEIGHLTSSLVATAMSGSALSHSPYHTTILIVLDLSKPEILWNSLEECLDALRKAMKISYSDELVREMLEQKKKTLKEPTADLFPMKVCLIGGKYDAFRELHVDDRELVGQVLRATAHTLGAGLHYHSAKDAHLLRKTKELLSQYGFRGQVARASVTDYEKPLSVVAGSDSFDAIDLGYSVGKPTTTLDAIGQIYVTRFPQDSGEPGAGVDESSQEAAEPLVDRLRLQREQEISVLLRQMLEAPSTNIPVPEPY